MAEPGAAKPAIQHKGSFQRRPHRAQAGRRRRPRTGRGAPAGHIPVTLRHAGGVRYPAEPAGLWQNEGFRIGKGTRPAAGARVTVELLSVIIARLRATVKLWWR